MIVVVPQRDSKKHDLTSTACECRCDVYIREDHMFAIHSQFNPNIKTKWVSTMEPENLQIEERVSLEILRKK